MLPTIEELADMARKIGDVLARYGIRFFITGGVVAAYYGEYRNTQDIDIVAEINACGTLDGLFDELARRFLISRPAFKDALRRRSMFQLLDTEKVIRAAVYVTNSCANRFDRTVPTEPVPGIVLPFPSPEDAILSKLVWIKMGSDRSKRDVVAMLRVQRDRLDMDYLDRTAGELSVTEILGALRTIAENYDPNVIF